MGEARESVEVSLIHVSLAICIARYEGKNTNVKVQKTRFGICLIKAHDLPTKIN